MEKSYVSKAAELLAARIGDEEGLQALYDLFSPVAELQFGEEKMMVHASTFEQVPLVNNDGSLRTNEDIALDFMVQRAVLGAARNAISIIKGHVQKAEKPKKKTTAEKVS